jgi:HK97 family phage major capsid protein
MSEKKQLEALPMLFRSLPLEAAVVRAADAPADAPPEDNAPVRVAISSETPVQRWFGPEILDHTARAVDMTLAQNGLAFLVGHDQTEASRLQIGLVRNITVDKDRVLRGDVHFSRDAEAQRVRQDMIDGIRPYISVGYSVAEYTVESAGSKSETYRATRWMPGEVSTVAVPADASVGVGRSSDDPRPVSIVRSSDNNTEEQEPAMKPEATPQADMERGAQAAEDRQKDVAAALEARNKEVAEITQLAISHGCSERAAEFIASGKSAGEIALDILAAKRTQPLTQPAAERGAPAILSEASKAPVYSMVRALAGAVLQSEGKRWNGFEAECDQEIRSKLPAGYKQQGGVFVPERQGSTPELRAAMRRQLGMVRAGLDSKTATSGAELVFDTPGDFIDLLRNMPVVTQMGATVLAGLSSPITFPKQTAAGTASWVGENPGSDVSDSDMDLTTVALAPKTLQSSTSYSRQLLAQQSFDVEALVRADLARIHALAIDRASLHGSGSSNEPTGIYAASGVNSKAMGGAVAFGELIDMATEVALDNALLGSTGFVTNPGMAGKLMQVLEFSSAGSKAIWTGTHAEGNVAGYRAMSTNQVSKVMTGSTTTGGSEYGIVFGNWADLIIGTWGALEIIVDPYRLKKQGMIEITSFQLADILVRRGESFCKATGATLA